MITKVFVQVSIFIYCIYIYVLYILWMQLFDVNGLQVYPN